MTNITQSGVFSIPGVEMRSTTDYPPSKVQPGRSTSPDMKTETAKKAGMSQGCTTDECGVRSSGGPQNPYEGTLGVPRPDAVTLKNKNIIRPQDENGGIPQISQEAMRSGSNQFMETSR
jgi:hypothetical protein